MDRRLSSDAVPALSAQTQMRRRNWAVAHRLGRLAWKMLHDRIHYIEQGTETNPKANKRRAQKFTLALRKLGYAVTMDISS
jgi:hypothetical protein